MLPHPRYCCRSSSEILRQRIGLHVVVVVPGHVNHVHVEIVGLHIGNLGLDLIDHLLKRSLVGRRQRKADHDLQSRVVDSPQSNHGFNDLVEVSLDAPQLVVQALRAVQAYRDDELFRLHAENLPDLPFDARGRQAVYWRVKMVKLAVVRDDAPGDLGIVASQRHFATSQVHPGKLIGLLKKRLNFLERQLALGFPLPNLAVDAPGLTSVGCNKS